MFHMPHDCKENGIRATDFNIVNEYKFISEPQIFFMARTIAFPLRKL